MLRLSSGVIVWAVHFAAIYGFTALACARGFGDTAPWAVGGFTAIAAAAALAIVVRNLDAEFSRWMAAALAGAALLAVVWEGLTALMVPNPCA